MSAGELVGYCAATLTTLSFVPQAWLTLKTRDVNRSSLAKQKGPRYARALLLCNWCARKDSNLRPLSS